MENKARLDCIVDGMKMNFLLEGSLVPLIFVFSENKFAAMPIPLELFDDENGKNKIRNQLIFLAKAPGVEFISVVFEASGMALVKGSLTEKLVNSYFQNGGRLQDYSEKVDLICCSYSSGTENKLIGYQVDVEKKTIGDQWLPDEAIVMGGRFAHLFPFQNWN